MNQQKLDERISEQVKQILEQEILSIFADLEKEGYHIWFHKLFVCRLFAIGLIVLGVLLIKSIGVITLGVGAALLSVNKVKYIIIIAKKNPNTDLREIIMTEIHLS